MAEKNIEIIKKNGKKLAGLMFVPDGDSKKYPTVIFSHGFNNNYKMLMHHGSGFAQAGIVCVFFDFYGGAMETQSEGSLNEMTLLTEAEDLEEVIEAVSGYECVDADNLFLQGESMGGFVSAYVAAMHPDKVRSLVLWYPAFVIPDDSRKRFEAGNCNVFGLDLNPDFDLIAKDIDIYNIIGKYEGPVLIIHGDADEIVPIAYSHKAVSTYTNSKLIVMENAGHGYDGKDSVNAREFSIEYMLDNIIKA